MTARGARVGHLCGMLLFLLSLSAVPLSAGSRVDISSMNRPQRDRHCGVCVAMMGEVSRMLDSTSRIKRQLVGSLGREMDYSRSEARRTDVLDRLCEKLTLFQGTNAYAPHDVERPPDAVDDEALFSHNRAKERIQVPPDRYWMCERLLIAHEAQLEERLFEMGTGWNLTLAFCEDIAGVCPRPEPTYFRLVSLRARDAEVEVPPAVTRRGDNFTYANNFTQRVESTWQEVSLTAPAGTRFTAKVTPHDPLTGKDLKKEDYFPDDESVDITVVDGDADEIVGRGKGPRYPKYTHDEHGVLRGFYFKKPGRHTVHIRDRFSHHSPVVIHADITPGKFNKVSMCRSPSDKVSVGEPLGKSPAICAKDGVGNTITDGVDKGVAARFTVSVAAGEPGSIKDVVVEGSAPGVPVPFDNDGVAFSPNMTFNSPGVYTIRGHAVDPVTGEVNTRIKPTSERKIVVYGRPSDVVLDTPETFVVGESPASIKARVVDDTNRTITTIDGGEVTLTIQREGDTDVRTISAVVNGGAATFTSLPAPTASGVHVLSVTTSLLPTASTSSHIPCFNPPVSLHWVTLAKDNSNDSSGDTSGEVKKDSATGGRKVMLRSEAGVAMDPVPVLEARDSEGKIAGGASGSVTVTRMSGPGRVAITAPGMTGGRVTLEGARIDVAGTYTLRATVNFGSTTVEAVSDAIEIVPGKPAKLRMTPSSTRSVVIGRVPPAREKPVAPADRTLKPLHYDLSVQVVDAVNNVIPAETVAGRGVTVRRTGGPGLAHGHGLESTNEQQLPVTNIEPTGVASFRDIVFDTPGNHALVFESPGLEPLRTTIRAMEPIARLEWSNKDLSTIEAFAGVVIHSRDHMLLVNGYSGDNQRYDVRGQAGVTVELEIEPKIEGIEGTKSVMSAGRAHFHGVKIPKVGAYKLRAVARTADGRAVEPTRSLTVRVTEGPSHLDLRSPAEGRVREKELIIDDFTRKYDGGIIKITVLDGAVSSPVRSPVATPHGVAVDLGVTRPDGSEVSSSTATSSAIGSLTYRDISVCDGCTLTLRARNAAARYPGFREETSLTVRFNDGKRDGGNNGGANQEGQAAGDEKQQPQHEDL